MIKNILLAEDDRSTALMVKTQLEAKGYWVYTAANGIEALKILSSQSIDLIITDVVMPKMDGVDLYEAVKKSPETTDIPIIIVTDKAMFKESFASLGVSHFLEKTTNINILLDKIAFIQKTANEAKKFSKILISGNHADVLKQMATALKGLNCLVIPAHSGDEILSKALTIRPHIIVMDVLFQDNVSAHELIRALRCFGFLGQAKIITYAFFPQDLGIDVEAVESVKEAMTLCSQAGSDQYIGRFNQGFFLEKLASLLT
ncbi:MAG: response regulator [Candidatus Omnitrophica bacterium]|nr:response regulator [Candidatus Omnitrophota bacterium]